MAIKNNTHENAPSLYSEIYSEARFPPMLSIRCAGGPVFSTSLIENFGGFEQRNINWQNARMRYNIAPAIRSYEDMSTIINFFRAHKGRAIGFRFKDWIDFKATGALVEIADGSSNEFLLCKRYNIEGIEGAEDIRRINKPVIDTVKIYCDAILQNSKIDYLNGKILFNTPPMKGTKVTADFEFDVFVRFDIDEIIINNDLQYTDNLDIPLLEIKI
jgi:uncharacterized protein (TIGR02217 family)